MILQALAEYYERKVRAGDPEIAPEGWISRPVDYVVVLDRTGRCIQLEQRFHLEKGKPVAKNEFLPAIGKQAMKHTNSGKDANLLWDNASFVFGFGKRGEMKLNSFVEAYREWLGGCEDDGLRALDAFYAQSGYGTDFFHKLVKKFGYEEDFEKRDPVIAFQLHDKDGDSAFLHFRPAIRKHYENKRKEISGVVGRCLVSGEEGVLALNETVIKGVWGGQTSGSNLVSFNANAFESYGKTAGRNAPIGKSTSFAYTTALNHLLRKGSPQRVQVGDASTVFWSAKPTKMETVIPGLFGHDKDDPNRHTQAVTALLGAVHHGRYVPDDRDTRFYVLGLAPNAARIAVRFWHVGTVGEFSERIARHFRDLEIVCGPKDQEYLPLFRLLVATAVQGKAENIPPNLGGEVMRAILDGTPYPQTLLAGAIRRIRAEREVGHVRAAIIKACLNRKTTNDKEVIQVALDPDNTNPGYRLGRLFAVLEQIQKEASGNINATIRDRYYGSASSTPVAVFATLLKLSKHHLAKLNPGRAINLERLIGEIISGIEDFPAHLALEDQGRFAIGYYHQRQSLFTKS
ncbi:type I-C CRISPR-associated protein Cas8c/Csd1, partial [Candidatus Parcubacteria bacterium]